MMRNPNSFVSIFHVPKEYWLKYLCGLYVRLNNCGPGVGFEPWSQMLRHRRSWVLPFCLELYYLPFLDNCNHNND